MNGFLGELTDEERADLERRGRIRRWRQGEVLFHEGDDSTWVGVLLSGRVKASTHGDNGMEAILAVREAGALIGEVAAIDGRPRSATVTGIESAEALVLTAEEFMGFLRDQGRVSLLIMRMICDRWRDADRKRAEFGLYDTTSRVAQRLVELAERFGEPYTGERPASIATERAAAAGPAQAGPVDPAGPGVIARRPAVTGRAGGAGEVGGADAGRIGGARRAGGGSGTGVGAGRAPVNGVQITLPLSQEELAGWIGASREAVSKALRTLRRQGWIQTGRRTVIVYDLDALKRRASR